MGLKDKASKVLDAVRRGDPRGAASALSDAIDGARVRLMDEVVSRVSGHAVHTEHGQGSQLDLPKTPPAPPAVRREPEPEPAPVSPKPAPQADDTPPPPAPAKPARKPDSAKEPSPPPAHVQPLPPKPAPEVEASQRLVLVARDPAWAFAHWAFSKAHLNEVGAGLTDPRALLRFYELGSDSPLIDADVSAEAGRYYLRVPRPGRSYEARLVLVGADGQLREVARSNDAQPPLQQVRSDEGLPQFVHTQAQSAVLAARDQVLVPPPRLVVDLDASAVPDDRPAPRSPQWAGVLAKLRSRRAAEDTGVAHDEAQGSGSGGLADSRKSQPEALQPDTQPVPWVAPSIKSARAPRSS